MSNLFTNEMIGKAKEAKSAGEIIALAKEQNIELTEEEAKEYYSLLNPKTGALSDEELDNVSGGCLNGEGWMVTTALYYCETDFKCNKCGVGINGQIYSEGGMRLMAGYYSVHTCPDGKRVELRCTNCSFCSYEGGVLLCKNPSNRK